MRYYWSQCPSSIRDLPRRHPTAWRFDLRRNRKGSSDAQAWLSKGFGQKLLEIFVGLLQQFEIVCVFCSLSPASKWGFASFLSRGDFYCHANLLQRGLCKPLRQQPTADHRLSWMNHSGMINIEIIEPYIIMSTDQNLIISHHVIMYNHVNK